MLGIYRSAFRRPLTGWSLGHLCSYESLYSSLVSGIQTSTNSSVKAAWFSTKIELKAPYWRESGSVYGEFIWIEYVWISHFGGKRSWHWKYEKSVTCDVWHATCEKWATQRSSTIVCVVHAISTSWQHQQTAAAVPVTRLISFPSSPLASFWAFASEFFFC